MVRGKPNVMGRVKAHLGRGGGSSRFHWLRWEELSTLDALVLGWNAELYKVEKAS
jgi:hypothetical protein